MSDGRSKLCDVIALADAGSELGFDMPIAGMRRLASALAGSDGRVSGTVRFDREQGRPVAQLAFTAQVQLRCQRCLEAMTVELQGGSLVHLVPDEAAARSLPEDAEMLLAPDNRVGLQELVEEDLLLSLPIAPRHERASGGGSKMDKCGAMLPATDGEDAQQVQRPFAALEEMLRSAARRGRGD